MTWVFPGKQLDYVKAFMFNNMGKSRLLLTYHGRWVR
jgi:hypothetical protein